MSDTRTDQGGVTEMDAQRMIEQVVDAAVGSLFGTEPDPAVFQYEIKTLDQCVVISARRIGVDPAVMLALLAAQADVASALAGRRLPVDALRVPADMSITEILHGFDGVARDLKAIFEEVGDWREVIAAWPLRKRLVMPNGQPASADDTRVYTERAQAYYEFFRGLLEKGPRITSH